MAGGGIGVIGISLITTTGEVSAGGHLLPGVLACLFATACYGLAGFLTRSWITHRGVLDAKLVAFGSQLGASLFLLPFSLTSWRPACGRLGRAHRLGQRTGGRRGLHRPRLSALFSTDRRYRPAAQPHRHLPHSPFGILWGALVLGETLSQGFVLGAWSSASRSGW